MTKSNKAPKFVHQKSVIGNLFRKIATVIVFPFAFIWFFLIFWKPELKKFWNPEPIKVYIVGRKIENDHHGIAYVHSNVRFRKEKVYGKGSEILIASEGLMQNPPMDIAFRVDRPDALNNPSHATIGIIRKKFEELGYEVSTLTLNVNGQKFVHML